MATGNSNNNNSSTGNDTVEVVELEAMRKDDFSWHPCNVSLCSGGFGLIVEYWNNDTGDIIVTKEEALARLRIRSTPLQGDECSLIKPGECVLASKKSQPMGLFFEAEVEKPLCVRHSKKIHCRCTFMVRWIHHGCEGETTIVPSSAIMKMASKCINAHPTISTFFNILTTPSHCTFSPLTTVVEGMDCEMESFELEKQIEEISNSADASGMKISENILFGIEVGIKRQDQCNPFAKSNAIASGIQLPPFFDRMKEMEVKGSQPPSPFLQEEFTESSTPLNPIAARAALASLMSKFSQSPECSLTLKEATVFRPQPSVGDEHVASKMSKRSIPYNVAFVSNTSIIHDDFSLDTEAATAPKYENIVKTLFPNKEATEEHKILDASSEASKWESKNKKCHPEIVDCVANIVCSTMKENIDMPASGFSYENVKVTCITEAKFIPSINKRRLTCSAVREAEGEGIALANNVNEEKPSSVQETALLEDKKTVFCPMYAETASTFTGKFKDQEVNYGMYNDNNSERKTCVVGIQILNNSRRLTRSAVRGKTENNNMEAHERFDQNRFTDSVKSDILKIDIASEIDAPETKSSSHTAERYKKAQKAASVKTAQKIEGDAASNDTRSQGVKRKSNNPKKQERRFSPRLRFLPQTRSQNKS